jgi:hypothetical protein
MSSSPTATSVVPSTLAAAQNGSVSTPFGLQCTPSLVRHHKSHELPLFPTTVNSATVGVHHRSTGSGDPLVPLSLPRGVSVRCEPHRPLLLHRRWPEPPHRVSLSTMSIGSSWTDAVRPPPPTSFDSKLQHVLEKLASPSEEHPAASYSSHRRRVPPSSWSCHLDVDPLLGWAASLFPFPSWFPAWRGSYRWRSHSHPAIVARPRAVIRPVTVPFFF